MEKEFGSGKIVLGMSGGVDSSVAALLLKSKDTTLLAYS